MSYVDDIRQHAGKLVRVEIIFSEALEEDFDQLFKEKKVAARYTKIKGIMGAGYSNPKLGDAIWPQLNTMFIIYTTEDESQKIIEIVEKLRLRYIGEGVACFISDATEV